MHQAQRMVEDFHRATGATIGDKPGIRDARLRIDLIHEEWEEFANALGFVDASGEDGYEAYDTAGSKAWTKEGLRVLPPDLEKAIDALADLLYVVYGAAVTFGIDIEPFFAEVHRSNLTKIGGPVREDGKRLKPDTYEPPNLQPILKHQEHMAQYRTWLRERKATRKDVVELARQECLDYENGCCLEYDGTGLWCDNCLKVVNAAE